MIEESAKELLTIEGIIENIVYQNSQNGYSVLDLAISEAEFITLTGIMPYIQEGETLKAMGTWEMHPTFGRQFKVEYFEKSLPASASTIFKYLSSRSVKGIGPVTARRIVDRFGTDSFEIIENHPEWLAELPGISESKAKEISEDFKRQFGMRNVMAFCSDFMGPASAIKVYKKYGSAAIDIIKQNPYILCDSITGIGFEKADQIAKALGLAHDSEERIKAGLIHVLKQNALSGGHVYLPRETLLQAACGLLDVSEEQISRTCDTQAEENMLKEVRINKTACVYLRQLYDAEMFIAEKLCRLQKNCPAYDMGNIEHFITRIEAENGIAYAPMQKKAITSMLKNGVMILTGGPGTGKTTIIRALIRVFDSIGMNIALAAPTGRAAKRMSEATQMEAKTIHRLLEIDFSTENNASFRRNENNYLDENVFIIDETSMIDTEIMCALLKAIKPGARLLLIGDCDQLPSVGPGQVLNDIINADLFETIRLTEVFRQASESMIVTNAHLINSGELPELECKNSDFFFLTRPNDNDIAKTIASLCANRLPKSYGPGIIKGLQVISPSKKGPAGTAMLNQLLQSVLNPGASQKREKKAGGITLREGDKVMQIRNNYDIQWKKGTVEGVGIYNGDIGVLQTINSNAEQVTVDFDGRVAVYDFTQLDELEHAYAITVHKSQGSEYPTVIIPIFDYTPRLLTRNLLYTAVTRAQQMVILVGRPDVVAGMVNNNLRANRYTGLRYILKKYGELL
ncbi:MAG: ATP-dependent RecD-like DNA helicase [Clostridiales bacterium]|nr:ATP-dependent RecD-like DNA helicase [Clostridiales bacterium]